MTKAKIAFAILLGLIIGCASTVGQAPLISIPLINSDFESVDVSGGGPITDPAGCGTATHFDSIPGWTFVHLVDGSGGGVAHWTCNDGMPNSNVAFLGYGEGMYQVTGEKARQGVYVVQFDVANWFYPYPGDWKVELFQGAFDASGNLVLSPAPFCSESSWGLGDMKRQTATCPMSGYLLQVTSPDPLSVGGQNPGGFVVLYLTSGVPNPALGGHHGWPVIIDNVTLAFSPSS